MRNNIYADVIPQRSRFIRLAGSFLVRTLLLKIIPFEKLTVIYLLTILATMLVICDVLVLIRLILIIALNGAIIPN